MPAARAASFILIEKSPLAGSASASPSARALEAVPTTLPPTAAHTCCIHASAAALPCLSSGTVAIMTTLRSPAEKTILPMWPAPPLRSSAVGSGSAFIAWTASLSRSMSPSGTSTEVQKNSRPPMSEAPSSSTPFLPPSLMAAFTFLARSLAGSSSFLSSFLGASLAPLDESPPLPPLSLPLPPEPEPAAGAAGGFSYTWGAEW
mmetsp:Transcript_1632/g.5300  ORF Transcript_1632/g.5300 Transcript_1632/m.5300 type:complete len:204 (-) Transcript_1632:473-1084(-)